MGRSFGRSGVLFQPARTSAGNETVLREEMDRLRRSAQGCERVLLATVLVTGNRCYLPSGWQARDPRNRILVDCIRRLPKDAEANLVNVHGSLASAGSLRDAGGLTYLLELTSADAAPPSTEFLTQLAQEATEQWGRYARANELLREAEVAIRGDA